MNPTQTQTTLAPIIAFIAGLLAGKGVFGLDAATWATVIGGGIAFVATIWAAIATRKTSMVASVNSMPEVAGVVTTNTTAGKAMAESVPSATVVPAGSSQAAAIAADGKK